MLTNEEKIGVVKQHMRNLVYNKYNLELSLLEESAVPKPKEDNIRTINNDLSSINLKIAALEKEISILESGE
jgi:hypothetical protein